MEIQLDCGCIRRVKGVPLVRLGDPMYCKVHGFRTVVALPESITVVDEPTETDEE